MAVARAQNANAATALAQLPAVTSSARNAKVEADTWLNRIIRPRSKAVAQTIGDFTGIVGNLWHGQRAK